MTRNRDAFRGPGTPAFFREHILGLTQRELAGEAGCTQTDVHLFEHAKVRLTRTRARQLAPVLFRDLHAINAFSAELAVFGLWFTVADAAGTPAIKGYVMKRRQAFEALGWKPPLWRDVVAVAAPITHLPDAGLGSQGSGCREGTA